MDEFLKRLEKLLIDYDCDSKELKSELDDLIADFNQYLAFDKWSVIRENDLITFKRLEKVIIDDPKKHWWKIDDTVPKIDPGEAESFQRIIDIVTDNLENKDFMDRMLGITPKDNDPAVEEIMKLIFDNDEAE